MFKPETLNLQKLFGNADSFYSMPIYQRPYSWDKERVEQLWNDLLDSFQSNQNDNITDENYFLGSIVVVPKEINKKTTFEVVDGQQRLTTLTILFCTLRDMGLLKNNTNLKRITNFIKCDTEDEHRLRLATHTGEKILFENFIIEKVDFNTTNH
jgi:uncharacterized protein with ParB-like and HNH nuclease domain